MKLVKKMKDTILKASVLSTLAFSNLALAWQGGRGGSASDIFDPINEKTRDFGDQLTLWASAICLVCIVGVGLLAMFGKFPKQWAVNVAVGSTVILLGANIANFLLG